MIRRKILWPVLLIAEIGALLLIVLVSRFDQDRAQKMLDAWEPKFPDPCWYDGGPWLEPIHFARIVMRSIR